MKALSNEEYKNVQILANTGYQEAIDFMSLFERFESIEDVRNEAPELLKAVIAKYDDGQKSFEDITFYKCKHLQQDKLCAIYETRPEFCRDFPATPWCEIPEGCGFYGWQFQLREEVIRSVRLKKEELIALYADMKIAPDAEKEKFRPRIEELETYVKSFSKFGSENW